MLFIYQKNIYQFNKSYFIKISSEGYDEGDMALSFYATSISTATTVTVSLNPNGITEIPAIKEDDFLAVYINISGKVGSFTVEQLPLYPGALVFDGVDDYGVCDNFPILTKEKGYTVVALRQWITYNPNAISAIATNASDQSFNGAFTLKITIKEQSKLFRMELLKYHYNIQNLLFLGKQHLSIMELILPMETKMRQIHLF